MRDFTNISIAELAALVNEKFTEHKMKAVLVGGACVAIYSDNRYVSYDLDFITYESMGKIKQVLSELGFKLQGKYFAHADCPFYIEFVPPPIAIGEEIIEEFETIKTAIGKIQLLTPTDCVKDRLASFFHRQDRQALEQAVLVFQSQKVDFKELNRWAQGENHLQQFEEFKKRVL